MGCQAGHHFNTFPLMDGQIVPEGYGGEVQLPLSDLQPASASLSFPSLSRARARVLSLAPPLLSLAL